jgi:NitT/TauT family transport system permease protein
MTTHGRTPVEMVQSILLLVGLLAVWELTVDWLEVSPILLPPPSAVAISLFNGLKSGLLVKHFGVTFFETVGGFLLGSVTGLLGGGLIAQSRTIERLLYPYVIAFQTVPKVAIAPLIVIWFGYGLSSKVVIAATLAFFPVLANTIVGLRSVPAEQLELMAAFMSTRSQTLWKVQMPQALPFILVGLDVGAVLAVIGAVVGEFVSAKEGLGFQILQSGFSLDTAGVFAVLVLLAVMGIAIHLAMGLLRKKVLYWVDDVSPINFSG